MILPILAVVAVATTIDTVIRTAKANAAERAEKDAESSSNVAIAPRPARSGTKLAPTSAPVPLSSTTATTIGVTAAILLGGIAFRLVRGR